MPFNPNVPSPHRPLDAVEICAQFNALKAQMDEQAGVIADLKAQLAGKPGPAEVQAMIAAGTARNVDSVAALPPPWSENPPDRAEFNETRDKVNEVLGGLKHPA